MVSIFLPGKLGGRQITKRKKISISLLALRPDSRLVFRSCFPYFTKRERWTKKTCWLQCRLSHVVSIFALKVVGAIIFQPINRGLPLRCLEEKYGLSNNHRDRLMAQERRSQKRLSLNITNGHTHDNTHAVHDSRDNNVGRGSQLRLVHNCQETLTDTLINTKHQYSSLTGVMCVFLDDYIFSMCNLLDLTTIYSVRLLYFLVPSDTSLLLKVGIGPQTK